jgi:transposase
MSLQPGPLRDTGTFRVLQRHRPIEASSGPRKRHRLNRRRNRKLNHAMHLIAVTQIRNDTPGRVYFYRKIAEGKSNKEALRALKRRISDAVWRQLQVDLKLR